MRIPIISRFLQDIVTELRITVRNPAKEREYVKFLGQEMTAALHEISRRTIPQRREVFRSKRGYSYVWCMQEAAHYPNSLLWKVESIESFPFSNIAQRRDTPKIVEALRDVYGKFIRNGKVSFTEMVFDNPLHYYPCATDLIDCSVPKERINIHYATQGGEEMAQGLEKVVKKFKISLGQGFKPHTEAHSHGL